MARPKTHVGSFLLFTLIPPSCAWVCMARRMSTCGELGRWFYTAMPLIGLMSLILCLSGCGGPTPPTLENLFARACVKASEVPSLTPIPLNKPFPSCSFAHAQAKLYASPFSGKLTQFSQSGSSISLAHSFVLQSQGYQPPHKKDAYYAYGYIVDTSGCIFMQNVYVLRTDLSNCSEPPPM